MPTQDDTLKPLLVQVAGACTSRLPASHAWGNYQIFQGRKYLSSATRFISVNATLRFMQAQEELVDVVVKEVYTFQLNGQRRSENPFFEATFFEDDQL